MCAFVRTNLNINNYFRFHLQEKALTTLNVFYLLVSNSKFCCSTARAFNKTCCWIFERILFLFLKNFGGFYRTQQMDHLLFLFSCFEVFCFSCTKFNSIFNWNWLSYKSTDKAAIRSHRYILNTQWYTKWITTAVIAKSKAIVHGKKS